MRRLKETNAVAPSVQQTVRSQTKDVTTKVAEPKKIKQADVTDGKDSKSDKLASNVSFDTPNESIVSFIKTTKEHVGKTLLAKKRDLSESKEKKSLSDIFLKQVDQSKSQSNIPSATQKHDIDKTSESNRESNVFPENEQFPSKETKRIGTNREGKKQKPKEKIANSGKELEKTVKSAHRVGGKFSSLFSNNPGVPIIGQRFVRPVNEPIFTKITFVDLNIHPFMVSTYVIIIRLMLKVK